MTPDSEINKQIVEQINHITGNCYHYQKECIYNELSLKAKNLSDGDNDKADSILDDLQTEELLKLILSSNKRSEDKVFKTLKKYTKENTEYYKDPKKNGQYYTPVILKEVLEEFEVKYKLASLEGDKV